MQNSEHPTFNIQRSTSKSRFEADYSIVKEQLRRNKLKLELRTGEKKHLSPYMARMCAIRAKKELTTELTEHTEKR